MPTLLLLAALGSVSLLADDAPPSPTERPRGSEDSDSTAARGISRTTSSALSAGIRYSPPKPTPVPAEPEKPKNEIVRLPSVVVLGQRPPVFSDRALREGANLDEFAKKRFLSEFDRGVLNRFGIPGVSTFSPERRARLLMQEQQRLDNIRDTNEHVLLYTASGESDRAAAAQDDAYSSAYRSGGTSTTRTEGTWYGEQR
ncbi:hypothetical protein [Nibricoccus sp. IMCC34717]|uniref:hypothetical protein n=1 Tax=Nibricoccus sp. IMCC34717 TaxID=3034021 RepID=UPI00384B855A